MKYNIKNLDKYTRLSILIILIGTIIRFYLAAIHHVAGDACWQLSNARFIAENMKLPLFEQFGRDEPFWAPPLFHIIAAFVYILFNNFGNNVAESAVKMITPIFSSLTLIFSFLVAKKLFNEKIGFYSIIFLAFVPLSLDFGVFSYVEGLLSFLSILSIYFALNNKVLYASIAAGLTILTKYNGIFILPVLIYIIYLNNRKNKQLLSKNILILLVISMAIGSIWFARNWVYLGNPVWPFMNDLFNGHEVLSFSEKGVGAINLSKIFDVNAVISIYIGIFGVPDGNINTIYFFKIPYIDTLLLLWTLGTLIFLIPFFLSVLSKKLKHRRLLFIWIIAYVILVLLYVVNASWSVARFMLPAFPAIAFIWGNGFERIKNKKMRQILLMTISIIVMGFVFTSFLKVSLAAKAWNLYNEDFEWIKLNTNKNTVFMSGSQCISYNINRQTVSPEISNIEKANYIFVNQKLSLDKRAIFGYNLFSEVKSRGKAVYKNDLTTTEIYKVE